MAIENAKLVPMRMRGLKSRLNIFICHGQARPTQNVSTPPSDSSP